jgi:hypothetical protein
MPLNIPIRKNSPLRGMFPPIIPSRLSELRPGTIDCFDGSCVADTVMVRTEADNGAILFMELDVFVFE